MKVKVGDEIMTCDVDRAEIVFIGKEYIIFRGPNGKEHCGHKSECGFWVPAEIEWAE
jgi:hypothetical protein